MFHVFTDGIVVGVGGRFSCHNNIGIAGGDLRKDTAHPFSYQPFDSVADDCSAHLFGDGYADLHPVATRFYVEKQ